MQSLNAELEPQESACYANLSWVFSTGSLKPLLGETLLERKQRELWLTSPCRLSTWGCRGAFCDFGIAFQGCEFVCVHCFLFLKNFLFIYSHMHALFLCITFLGEKVHKFLFTLWGTFPHSSFSQSISLKILPYIYLSTYFKWVINTNLIPLPLT
jgi:hypothetical protein